MTSSYLLEADCKWQQFVAQHAYLRGACFVVTHRESIILVQILFGAQKYNVITFYFNSQIQSVNTKLISKVMTVSLFTDTQVHHICYFYECPIESKNVSKAFHELDVAIFWTYRLSEDKCTCIYSNAGVFL